MLERNVSRVVKRVLSKNACYCVVFHGSNITRNGTPDILGVGPSGEFVGIECKVSGGRMSINQWRRCLEILASGGRFIVACEDFSTDTLYGQGPFEVVHAVDDEFSLYDRFLSFSRSCEIVAEEA